jgi:hypothetical protein
MYGPRPNPSQPSIVSWSVAGKAVGGLFVGLMLIGAMLGRHWVGDFVRKFVPSGDETWTPPVLDPRETFETPYRNVRPEVKYVGDKVCAGCHVSEADSYRHHPMGRSFAPIAVVAPEQRYEKAVGDPFRSKGFELAIEKRGQQIFHEEIGRNASGQEISKTSVEIQFAVGSGTHAYSYLLQRGDHLFQSPVTWYTQKNVWDLSPGFSERRDRFERPILPGCLFCHVNQAHHVADTLNQYERPTFQGYAIGCERCHGPGALHVASRQAAEVVDGIDYNIVNPRQLAPKLRDAVCEQCHLGGKARVLPRGRKAFDYRPGLPLELFWTVFVKPPESSDELRIAGHAEQMVSSGCFKASDGKLGCISCHDAHRLPEESEKVAYYRKQCLNCHGKRPGKGCSLPVEARRKQSPADSCIDCHMPQGGTNVSHVALTDHRIPRHAAKTPPALAYGPDSRWVHFHENRLDLTDPAMSRDLGVALIDVLRNKPDPQSRMELSQFALPLLERATQAHLDDIPAREALGLAQGLQGRLQDALATCEQTLAQAPEREVTLADAAMIAQSLKRPDQSLAYWQRALAIDPWSSHYRYEVANLLAQGGDWDKAEAECRKVLEYNASHQKSRLLLVECELHRGDKDKARAEFKTLLELYPQDAERLRQQLHGGP